MTFCKRSNGVLKKAYELSELSGATVVLYAFYNGTFKSYISDHAKHVMSSHNAKTAITLLSAEHAKHVHSLPKDT